MPSSRACAWRDPAGGLGYRLVSSAPALRRFNRRAEWSSSAARDLDFVGIKREMGPDLSDVRFRQLVGPDRVVVASLAIGDRVIIRLALIRASRDAGGALKRAHVHVGAGNVDDRRIVRLAQLQCAFAVADRAPMPDHPHPLMDRFDRDRMILGSCLSHNDLSLKGSSVHPKPYLGTSAAIRYACP